jgi:23S rRNA (cytidine2498-2'-O)-methyltransferase
MANAAATVIDATPGMAGLLCYCRQGFEPELAAELSERAASAGYPGYARTERNSAQVVFVCDEGAALSNALPWRELIYARQKLRLIAELRGLDPKDRITPMLAALAEQSCFGDLWVEHPDSDASKPLAGLARSFGNALGNPPHAAGVLGLRSRLGSGEIPCAENR